MSAHPQVTNAQIREHLACMKRLEGYVAPRVVCAYCEHVISPGQEPASHAICSHRDCKDLSENPIGRHMIEHLHIVSSLAWGRFVPCRGTAEEQAALKAEYERAETRFRTALRLLVEDMERGK